MSKNLVNLNVNPCKMCMPMGSVSAFYGIKKCMTILHGSQGCATYIRRHMATHYNEPVDIASSSLTEEGTVFGGEKNLIKGLETLIKLYEPEVIGVSTTCLAETIGEDLKRMIKDFNETHPDYKGKIIHVSTAGYAGTQYEGFFQALRAIVEQVEMKPEKHDGINVITGMISPADTRFLKSVFDSMRLDVVLLPDLSENLDGVHQPVYNRLPQHGTSVEDISKMAGARYTIELSTFIENEKSPGYYLEKTYGVPLIRLNLPVGLRDTDAFLEALTKTGAKVPKALIQSRGRYLDAMVDSHKYNAEGRAAIFGEPDFVYSMTQLCIENGLMSTVAATGAKCSALEDKIKTGIAEVGQFMFNDHFVIAQDTDFDHIEQFIVDTKANVMIGSSDGRRIEEKMGVPLVRCAFPIHDHIGGQRVRMLGYEGSIDLLDRVTNTLLTLKESSYRETLYDKYYDETRKAPELKLVVGGKMSIEEKTKKHPCFNGCGTGYARIHLPIAPACNIQCNYCVRKYDCPNESRPGVTTQTLSPEEAYKKYVYVKEKMPNLTVVGIAGPGDALANYEKTRETLQLIHAYDPDVTFCISTNGLMLPQYANELVELGVSHVTVTLNAVDPRIGKDIYQYIDYMGTRYTGEIGASILLANQLAGIKMLTEKGLIVKVNTVVLKGINDAHIGAVVEKAKELGCEITNLMQMIPVKGSVFENMPLTSNKEIMEIRKQNSAILKQMYHCKQCRADAVGTLDNDESFSLEAESEAWKTQVTTIDVLSEKVSDTPVKPALPLFAVASKGGILVDQHFGHASDFYIYEYEGGTVRFKERRSVSKYCDGSESCDGNGGGKNVKMDQILEAVQDCVCVVAMRIGEAPKRKLMEKGVKVMMTYGRIEEVVDEAARAFRSERAI